MSRELFPLRAHTVANMCTGIVRQTQMFLHPKLSRFGFLVAGPGTSGKNRFGITSVSGEQGHASLGSCLVHGMLIVPDATGGNLFRPDRRTDSDPSGSGFAEVAARLGGIIGGSKLGLSIVRLAFSGVIDTGTRFEGVATQQRESSMSVCPNPSNSVASRTDAEAKRAPSR